MHISAGKNKVGVTVVLIPHNDLGKFRLRVERDLLPTILAHPDWDFQVVVIDNSDEYNKSICHTFDDHQLEHIYIWSGENIMYGPAMNLAIGVSDHSHLVYVCTNHGHMYDTTWMDDLVEPLVADSNVAMTGSLCPSGADPIHMGFQTQLPRVHIQGGLFGANVAILKKYPYTLDQRWVHGGSDIYQSYQLMQAGFMLRDVPTVKSVWWPGVVAKGQWKYVHDYSER